MQIKNWLRNLFASDPKDSSKEPNRIDDLSQPKPQNKTPENKRRRNQKIITWIIVIALISTIVGVIIYFATRRPYDEVFVKQAQTEQRVVKITKANPTNDYSQPEVLTFDENNIRNAEVTIKTGNSYRVVASTINSPKKFSFTVVKEGIEKFRIGETLIHVPINQTRTGSETNNWNWFIGIILEKAKLPNPGFNPQVIISPLISIIFIAIMIYVMSRMARAQNESLLGTGKTNAKLTKSNVRFTDVAGIAEVKQELIEIVDFLKDPRKYVAAGARIPKGVILYGPPGTGKTLIAKAVAGEANVPFFQTTGSAFEDTFVGVGARRIRELFEKARKAAPAIIFIDEIDSVAKKRGNSLTAVQDQTINQLLSELDGFETSSGVIVMAATNRLDTLDDAVLRPGRFDRHISVNLPDIAEREQILKIHSRNKNLSAKVNLKDIARRTPGFSGAQLENTLNEAALLSVRDNKTVITMKHLDEAIDRVIAGPSRPNKVITDRERKQIAYHEAGHALVGLYTPGVDVVQKITIVARGRAAGYTLQTPEKQENILQRKLDLIGRIRVALGGRAAEELIFGVDEITTGAANDFYKITLIARAMVASYGMTSLGLTQHILTEGVENPYRNNYSEQTAQQIDVEVEKIIQQEYAFVKELILKHRDEMDMIVETLLELETILKPQIDYIHEHKELPKEVIEAREKRLADEAKKSDDDAEEADVVDEQSTNKQN